ncbi:hypothetical protein [Flavobacterium sp.]|uniref:hypothetical protein n=1 Tax=Flavobacterium sp. TaxID=239 RepID=UPI0026268EE3|nr:hypothetical protein [Flavobacterium sp.]
MKIKLHPDLARKLAKEFNVSSQTVLTSISYFNNSPRAQTIRQRAKELLIEEANKIIIKLEEEEE